MIEEQRKQITEYRKQWFGYKSIAMVVGLSRESVRAFCKRNGLDGYGKDFKKKLYRKPHTIQAIVRIAENPSIRAITTDGPEYTAPKNAN